MTFPILYKRAKTKKINRWSIVVKETPDGVFIETTRGQCDGKLVVTSREVKEGKGKRSVIEQAKFVANKKWNDKQTKDFYHPDINEIDNIKIVKPMLATKFNMKKIEFPCITQPKLDGLRCIAYLHEGEIVLESRQKKRYYNLKHITKKLQDFLKKNPTIYLDGELFSSNLKFEEISGLCRLKQTVTNPEKITKVEFWIYDCFHLKVQQEFEIRYSFLKQQKFNHPIKLVKNKIIKTPCKKEFMKVHDEYVLNGYEGLMVRNKRAFYEIDKRSNNLQKLKQFCEEEFVITGYKEGEGTFKNTLIWICKTKQGKQFMATPRGSLEYRKQLFSLGDQFVGKQITVIYQELTKDGIPRFPIAKAIRIDY